MHRALADHGLADQRGVDQYALHGRGDGERIVGRVIGKGLAGDEMGERVYLVVDGVDAQVHHVEFADPACLDEVERSMIVKVVPQSPVRRRRIATSPSWRRTVRVSTSRVGMSNSSATASSGRAKTRRP